MKGMHHIVVETARLKYEFDIRRNITVIQGDSATGKTTLVELLRAYSRFGQGSGVMLQSDVPCEVFSAPHNMWQVALEEYENSILFFDEDEAFIFSKEFAETIRDSSNYYVLITRQALPNLPYSVQEIYGIRTTGKFHFPEKVYHEFYPIYDAKEREKKANAYILVEDERAGFQFYKNICGEKRCISAKGNANIYRILLEWSKEEHITVVADGAAFGAFIANVLSIAKRNKRIQLYFPESFEWLILKSGIVSVADLEDILENPEKYIESAKYFSWERYFTDLLESATADNPINRYYKNSLSPFYTEGRNRERILAVMPKEVREELLGD